MKRLMFLLGLLVCMGLLFIPSAQARVISSEKEVIVEKNEVIDDDLFVAGERVIIEGVVNGDLYAAGGDVKIGGTVNGDALVGGGTIEITGWIKDDVRVAGGNINIQGASIGDSLTLVGGNINVEEGSAVGGGVLFGAGSVNINTDVGRGIMGGGGSVNIDGAVGRSIYVGTEQLRLGPSTVVAGDLTYAADKEAKLSKTAIVRGKVRHVLPTKKQATVGATKPALVGTMGKKFKLGVRLWSYLAGLVVGGLALYFFKKPSQQIVKSLEKNWLTCLGWGFLLAVAALPAFIMLSITVIGFPLAVILGLVFVIDIYLSKLVIGMVLGRKIEGFFPKQKLSIYLSFAFGLAVYYVLSALPILGGFVALLALLLGLGALFVYTKSQLARSR